MIKEGHLKNLRYEQMAQMSEFFIQNRFKMLPEIIKTYRILQSGLAHNSKFSLGPHKIISVPNQLEVAWNTMPTFPKMD